MCTLLDMFASACGALFVIAIKNYVYWPGFAPVIGAIVAGAGFFYMTFWINEGYGRVLEHISADLRCFFTESYGFGFIFVIAPALTVVTLLREWVIVRTTGLQGVGNRD